MTTFRQTTPDAEAAQYLPTDEEPLTFSDRPAWLETLLEVGDVALREQLGEPYLVLQAQTGPTFVAAGDWIVRDRWANLSALAPDRFAHDFDLFEDPATPSEPAAGAATGSQDATETTGATK